MALIKGGGGGRQAAVATFETTTDALAVQAAAGSLGLGGRLAPVPRHLSASCGLAWRESGASADELRAALAAAGLRFEDVCALDAR